MQHETDTQVPPIFNGKISPADISAAKHVPIATVVMPVVPLDRRGFGLCPVHEERTPSFHIDRKRNRWHCFGCGAGGDTISFLQAVRGLDFASAIRDLIGGRTGNVAAERQVRRFLPRSASEPDTLEYIRRLWSAATDPEVAEFYLASRGIRVRPKALPAALRGSKRVWCAETKAARPALLAAIRNDCGEVVALQRIWTESWYEADNRKGAKAQLNTPKKTLGRLANGAVRLAEPGPILGIAEGVETAMSAASMFCVPVWASLGAARMGAILLPVGVTRVTRVVVFGDNGGETAAHAAVSAYRRRGYEAEAVFPEAPYGDFNDQLMGWR